MSIEKEESDKEQIFQEDTTNDLNTEDNEKEETKDGWIDILGSGVIMKKILKEGTPDTRPEKQQTCIINYELFVEEGEIIQREENFEIDLGDNDVVQGLDVSIGLMNVGEVCLLKIQPRLAFGIMGLPPKINKDTTVTYKIELVSVSDEELESMNLTLRKIKGNKKKERGNYWYARREYSIALQCYRKSLDYLDEVEGGIKFPDSNKEDISDSALQELLEDRLNVYNNLAAAQIKLELYDAAMNSLKTVLKCQPNNVKALFREALVYKSKGDIASAKQSILKAKKVAPDDRDIINELTRLNQISEKQKKTERELAKRMFGSQSSTKNSKEHPKSKVFFWTTVAASVAVAVAGLASYRLKYF